MDRFRPLQVLPNMRVVNSSARVTVAQRPPTGRLDVDSVDVDRDPVLEAAYSRGLEEGRAAAVRTYEPQVAALEAEAEELARQLPAALSQYFRDLEEQARDEVCELAFAIAERVLHHELATADHSRQLVRQALAPLLDLRGVCLRVCPRDAERLARPAEHLLPAGVTLEADGTLGPGEAMVECAHGLLDVTVAGRLQALREAFEQRRLESEEEDAPPA